MAPTRCSLMWFRQDLRLADNPALTAALARGGPVVPVYIWAPEEEGDWSPGAASRWWLHQSLKALDADLQKLGSRLIIRRGPSLKTLQTLLNETGADKVYWNRRYEPAVIERDRHIKAALPADSFNAALLFEPWEIETQSGGPYKVFTPFWKTCLTKIHGRDGAPRRPLEEGNGRRGAPSLPGPAKWPSSLGLDDLELEPRIDWAAGFREVWIPGERGALKQLKQFLDERVGAYAEDRDRPDKVGTSRLSPHLHFGEISPRQIWAACQKAKTSRGIGTFLRELGWREFAHHLLYHFPTTPTEPLRQEFAAFPWKMDNQLLKHWQKGETGYPLVDAGMRELWTTGWMHNRVRMVVASFLVKDLLIPWQEGARWFWDTLVDADLANNTLGWQWTAGCGADAAPFFRVFNPTSQAEKFDPRSEYTRRWVKTPSEPIVDHAAARERALEAYQHIKA